MRTMILGVALISLALVACGSHNASERGGSRSASATKSDSGTPGELPPDVVAYIEIARASGSLRGSAARAALGQALRLGDTAGLAAFVPRVTKLRPSDGGLIALRDRCDQSRVATVCRSPSAAGEPDPRLAVGRDQDGKLRARE
jgi:hypothetical protein